MFDSKQSLEIETNEKKYYIYLVPVCRYWQQTNMLLVVSSSNKSNDRPNIKIHTNIDAQMKGKIKEKQQRYAFSIHLLVFAFFDAFICSSIDVRQLCVCVTFDFKLPISKHGYGVGFHHML